MNQTLVLLKPDCVYRHLVGTVLHRFEQKGLRIVAMKIMHVSRELAEKHYAVHKERPFYESLITFLTSGPMVALVLHGREAINIARNLIGPTDGAKAPPGTIRGDFALSVQNNLVHGSDSPESAAYEISLWFKPDELVNYQMIDVDVITGKN
jgi:nucleoside-diphosphate kinase